MEKRGCEKGKKFYDIILNQTLSWNMIVVIREELGILKRIEIDTLNAKLQNIMEHWRRLNTKFSIPPLKGEGKWTRFGDYVIPRTIGLIPQQIFLNHFQDRTVRTTLVISHGKTTLEPEGTLAPKSLENVDYVPWNFKKL